ncbi:methylmalonyl-CoA mutase subunit beta [Arenibacter sp. BSSL-BM3]|uniref:Methylmalonyl-CoA mutase subunit beta n=2 Tax=Arenibacter arenosicollis TaxID=2762274 RepID=A0ABR7QSJ0_9FLAO|nr:methylmalonyl-CoA mutase subunit beta [Arenibacter arenosicollis]MBC8770158.1 methylmalonyl-CoA mutase subunit beta [Arenibacter arenosicollis]
MSNLKLFNDFPEISSKAWKQKIQFDLQGEDYNEKLVWESPEGIKVKPFYHSEDLKALKLKGATKNTGWRIGQGIFSGNTKLANKKALDAIARGAESIQFTIPSEEIKIHELLKEIDLGQTDIYFNLQFLSSSYVISILEATKNQINKVYLNVDIIGNLAKNGNWQFNLNQDHKILDDILNLNHTQTLCVDVALYENAGANLIQQLAYAVAHANEYLNHLNDKHKDTLKRTVITFKVSVGSNYFFEIAKLRALRILFGTLAQEYGALEQCHIIATPTFRNKTLYDYNNNMLRTTTECMSAILGEADMVINMPYDAIYHKDNEFGERMARNQLLILKHESYFDKVDNAADGTYYIESITHQLSTKALDLFKQIEAGGGFLVQLKEHIIQKKIKESAAKEQDNFNRLDKILVGTNKHASRLDKMKDNLEMYPFVKTNTRKTLIEPIIEKRLSEDWEQKRLKIE